MNKEDKDSIVARGGIAQDQADAEDVTRDTYGFAEPGPIAEERDKRLAEADRTASALGLPGAEVPEGSSADEARAAEYLRAEVGGDRTAPRRDAQQPPTPEKPGRRPHEPPPGDRDRDDDEAPETPPTEPGPVPVREPPDAPGKRGPYVVD